MVFAALVEVLNALATVAPERVPFAALAGLWHLVIVLGFAPVADRCARCERALGSRAWFALAEGGLLCPACGRGMGGGALDAADQAALRAFLLGAEAGVVLSAPHLAAHRRLFARFVRRHVTDDAPLPALAFWESRG
jgi:recombinational DNA repair protein (RecF pathway)